MTATTSPNPRLMNQYLDIVLHAFSTGRRLHSDTREKILQVLMSSQSNDPDLEAFLRQEIEAYNQNPGSVRGQSTRSLLADVH